LLVTDPDLVQGSDKPDQEDTDANVDEFHSRPLLSLWSRRRLLGIMTGYCTEMRRNGRVEEGIDASQARRRIVGGKRRQAQAPGCGFVSGSFRGLCLLVRSVSHSLGVLAAQCSHAHAVSRVPSSGGLSDMTSMVRKLAIRASAWVGFDI